MAIVPEFCSVPLPFGIMVSDIAQLILGVLTKSAPGELERLDISF